MEADPYNLAGALAVEEVQEEHEGEEEVVVSHIHLCDSPAHQAQVHEECVRGGEDNLTGEDLDGIHHAAEVYVLHGNQLLEVGARWNDSLDRDDAQVEAAEAAAELPKKVAAHVCNLVARPDLDPVLLDEYPTLALALLIAPALSECPVQIAPFHALGTHGHDGVHRRHDVRTLEGRVHGDSREGHVYKDLDYVLDRSAVDPRASSRGSQNPDSLVAEVPADILLEVVHVDTRWVVAVGRACNHDSR